MIIHIRKTFLLDKLESFGSCIVVSSLVNPNTWSTKNIDKKEMREISEQSREVITLDVTLFKVSYFSKSLPNLESSQLVERVVCSPWALFLMSHWFFGITSV